jgi:hypothetical protein
VSASRRQFFGQWLKLGGEWYHLAYDLRRWPWVVTYVNGESVLGKANDVPLADFYAFERALTPEEVRRQYELWRQATPPEPKPLDDLSVAFHWRSTGLAEPCPECAEYARRYLADRP